MLAVLRLVPMAGPWHSLELAISDRNGSSSRPSVGIESRAKTAACVGLSLTVRQLVTSECMCLVSGLVVLWLATIRQLVTSMNALMLVPRR